MTVTWIYCINRHTGLVGTLKVTKYSANCGYYLV